MIVYADRTEEVAPGEVHRRLAALGADHEALVEGLILAGQLEAGLADHWRAEEDEVDPRVEAARATTLAYARAVVGSWAGRAFPRPAVTPIAALPDRVRVSLPEGYAWYATYPEVWADAARRFAREAPAPEVAVVGLRSIGTSLSAVVHAALEAEGIRVRSCTVRPRGHPFDRRPRLGPALAATLRAPWVLIVDEGPGLSGSSLCGTAGAIAELGVPDERIVLLPAWCPDGSAFVSAAARARWPRHRKLVGDGAAVIDRILGPGEDWSGGRWRAALGCWPPVEPRHERIKRVVAGGVARFAGLGAHGRRVRDRALRLAERGLGPAVRELRHGFLVQERIEGRPVSPDDPALLPAVVERLRIAAAEPTDRPVPVDALVALVETNLAEAGLPVPPLDGFRALGGEATVAIDGRMMAHEWLATARGIVKTDGADHCEDHFFPGFQDLAWDVAGVAIELGPALRDAALHQLGDPALRRRVPLYEVAYAAFRVGYATMARDATAGEERRRWEVELRRLHGEARRAVGASCRSSSTSSTRTRRSAAPGCRGSPARTGRTSGSSCPGCARCCGRSRSARADRGSRSPRTRTTWATAT